MVQFFQILTKPPILDTSAPFAISGLPIKTKQELNLFVTHTKPQLLTRRNRRVTVIQSQLSSEAIGPVAGD